jgi:asparagine synthase (glutamine-hydrolysing)
MDSSSIIYEDNNVICILNPNNWKLTNKKDIKIYSYKYNPTPKNLTIEYCEKIGMTFFSINNKGDLVVNAGTMAVTPIYYKISDGIIYVTDDIHNIWIDEGLDYDSIIDLLTYKVSLDKYTLIENIYHLFSGQKIISNRKGYKLIDGHNYPKIENRIYDKDTLMEELYDISIPIFRDIKRITKDKHILHFLSGGCDSRYIVSMFKILDFQNVTCISYGINDRGNDAKLSKRVAEELGYDWIYIDYSTEEQIKYYMTEDFRELLANSHNYYTIPYFQEYLALSKLKEDFTPDNTIITTGMEAGTRSFTRRELANGILLIKQFEGLVLGTMYKHKTVNSRMVPESSYNRLYKELYEVWKEHPDLDLFEMGQIINWRDRHTKFQGNSTKTLEWMGYSWIYPFYDRRLFDFWSKVPPIYKGKKSFFINFCDKYLFKPLKIDFILNSKKKSIIAKLGLYENILYHYYKYFLYKHLINFYKNIMNKEIVMPNKLDFDKIFKYMDKKLIQPELNELIDKIRYKYDIREWKGDPNFYLTNASVKLVIQEILTRDQRYMEKLGALYN